MLLYFISFFSTNQENYLKPINIFQTWKTKKIHNSYQPLVSKVKKLNPNSNYIFYDDKQIEKFIKNKYPEYYTIYSKLPYKIQKIDFFRYLIVYHYGGIYLDLDIDLYHSLSDMDLSRPNFAIEFEKNSDKILQQQKCSILLGNYAFYSPRKHPFLKKIIDNLVNNRLISIVNKNDYKKYVYYTTGPVLVTQSYLDYHNKNDIILLKTIPFRKSHFGKYGKHKAMGSWKKIGKYS